MAKAKEIAGLDCDGDVHEWIREILRARLTEILELRAATQQSEDVEAIHDARVAIRRMRTALRDFAAFLKSKPAKKLKRDLKHLADSLGAARDADVVILALEKLHRKTDDAAYKQGIENLIEQRRHIRKQAQNYLIETFDDELIGNLEKDFDQFVSTIRAPKKAKKLISFNAAGRAAVADSLDKFIALGKNIYQPFDENSLHELRIAAKHLRYALELYAACWGKKIAPFAGQISDLQSYLGKVHDADVWLKDLSKQLIKEIDLTSVKLLSNFTMKRTKNYRRALKLWTEWQKKSFLEDLRAVILQTGI